MVALLLSYGLGEMIWFGLSKLAVMLAIGITTLLYFKPELRGFSQRLTRRDLVAVLQFSVLSFIALPILPNQDFGPYNAFNPYQAWMMVVLISGISLAGYAALHVVGTRYGAPLLGFLGGMVSSTATTMIYAKHGKASQAMTHLASAVIVIASMACQSAIVALQAVLEAANGPEAEDDMLMMEPAAVTAPIVRDAETDAILAETTAGLSSRLAALTIAHEQAITSEFYASILGRVERLSAHPSRDRS